jgi:hypothetical protein
MKNWTGNSHSIYVAHGASNHSEVEREKHDYYATHPLAVEKLLERETFSRNILEPACGEGHISKVLENHNYNVISYDLVNRGYGEVKNFFDIKEWNGDIITNPPYKFAQKFVEHSLEIIPQGNKIAMLLKLTFLEGQKRYNLFQRHNLETVYVFSKRTICAMNGNFNHYKSSAVAYAWFIFRNKYIEDAVIKWIW